MFLLGEGVLCKREGEKKKMTNFLFLGFLKTKGALSEREEVLKQCFVLLHNGSLTPASHVFLHLTRPTPTHLLPAPVWGSCQSVLRSGTVSDGPIRNAAISQPPEW